MSESNGKNNKSSSTVVGNGKGSTDNVENPRKFKKNDSVEIQNPEGSVTETILQDENPDVPEEDVTKEERQGLMKLLSKAIGDVTAVTLPVTLNEPASFLMRLCEQLQYSELLDKANLLDDSSQRLMCVSVFAATLYAVAERTCKPFNPLLGETYEFVDPKRGNLKFIAEQVSHHPPIGACFAENDNFKFWEAQQLKSKFGGNSLDCVSLGSMNVYLKRHNEYYRWEALKTTVHNVIVGKIWLDHYGEAEIKNITSGEKAVLNFTKCGWFSKGWHEVSGNVLDLKGTPVIQIFGKWNESIYAKSIGTPPADTSNMSKKEAKQVVREQRKEEKEFKKQVLKNLTAEEPLWVHTYKSLDPSKLPCKYMGEWTTHSLVITELTDEMRKILPPTDSRIRGDRYALEKEDTKKAAAEKHTLEEKQRAEEKKRIANNQTWVPRYFVQSKQSEHDWDYNGKYWEEREARLARK